MTQKELSDLTSIKPPQVNRYVRGTSNIQPEILGSLLKAFPEEKRAELLAAYLKDAIPDGFDHLVAILTNEALVKEDTAAFRLPEETDPELQRIIASLTKRAIQRKEVRDMLLNFEALMQP